jgi:hypothetical protein
MERLSAKFKKTTNNVIKVHVTEGDLFTKPVMFSNLLLNALEK